MTATLPRAALADSLALGWFTGAPLARGCVGRLHAPLRRGLLGRDGVRIGNPTPTARTLMITESLLGCGKVRIGNWREAVV